MSHDITESEHVELKTSTSELKEAIISIVAILNKHGKGELYFGIKDNATVVGQQVSSQTLRKVSQTIANAIEPKIYPEVSKIKVEEKTCLKVVFSGSEMPYFAYGRAYIRVGDEDRTLSAKELEKMILKKNRSRSDWDREICEEATLEDIDKDKLASYLDEAGLKYDNVENSLKKLDLISKNKPRNSAVLFFGDDPTSFLPNAQLRCAVFGTIDTSYTISMQDYTGDILSLIARAEEFILQHINIGMELDGLRRVDVPEISPTAFREAIINAFTHRDWREYDSVNIAVFKDRVEIRSPGLLYGGLTIESIQKEMVSERRNELIANLFHRIHMVEKWGRGISTIMSEEPDTTFKEVGTHFIVVFHRTGSEKSSEKSSEKTSERIIELMIQDPKISANQLASALGITNRAVEKQISKLKDRGKIKRIGPAKGGHWEVIEEKE